MYFFSFYFTFLDQKYHQHLKDSLQSNFTSSNNLFSYLFAAFTPSILTLNAGDEVLKQPIYDNYLDYFSTDTLISLGRDNHSFVQQMKIIKDAFSPTYFVDYGFNYSKQILPDQSILFLQNISDFHQLKLFINQNNFPIDIPTSTLFETNVTQIELIFSSRQYSILPSAPVIIFEPEEALLVLTKKVQYSNSLSRSV